MNKKEFIDMIANKAKITKNDAEIALYAVTASLTELLAKGDSIVLPGFASIAVKKRAARKGRNPSTGAPIDIPASNAISFKAGTKLKEAINN
ncbi:MAG: DNA-binding protein HU [Candidatus Puniceispirillum sp.]|nr:DNA-binding protein HU [Candidatus Puniceispirillum sp.]